MLDDIFPQRMDAFKLESDISLLTKVNTDRSSLSSGMNRTELSFLCFDAFDFFNSTILKYLLQHRFHLRHRYSPDSIIASPLSHHK